jgi:hypothetical protein
MLGQAQIWTFMIDGADITITPDYGFTTISILSSGGLTTITGNKTTNGIDSQPITLADGQSITINSGNSETNIIDYLYINANGQAHIVAR